MRRPGSAPWESIRERDEPVPLRLLPGRGTSGAGGGVLLGDRGPLHHPSDGSPPPACVGRNFMSVTAAEGFVAAGVHAGLKASKRDMALLATDDGNPVPTAAVF